MAPAMVALLDEMAAAARLERKPKTLSARVDEMDQIWIAEMESEPALHGVDVRAALAEAQFWCRNNSRVCTRKFFTNWILSPKNRVVRNPGGPLGKPANGSNGHAAPAGWLARLNERFPDCAYARGGAVEITEETDYHFSQLPETVRKQLR